MRAATVAFAVLVPVGGLAVTRWDPGAAATTPKLQPHAVRADRVNLLDGARGLTIEVRAGAFDGPCRTALATEVAETPDTITVTVTAHDRVAAPDCRVEPRSVVAPLTDVIAHRRVVDGATGEVVRIGALVPGGEQPGDLSISLEGTLGADGRTLTLAFSGAADGDGPCGVRYEASARETDDRVEIAVRGHPTGTAGICPDVAGRRTATVTLAAPLAGRPVFDRAGRQLAVTAAG